MIRMPTNSSPGTVRLQLHRCINEWGAKIMPILPSQTGAMSWSKVHRQANWRMMLLQQRMTRWFAPLPRALPRLPTSPMTSTIYRNERNSSCEDIMVVLDSDTKKQRLYKGRLQYQYYNCDSDESDHVDGLFAREGEASSSVTAPELSQSSIPAYDAKAEPWSIQCVDCEPRCSPRSIDSDTTRHCTLDLNLSATLTPPPLAVYPFC